MKKLIKVLAITFVLTGGAILMKGNPTLAMDGLLSPQEVNTNYQDSIVYTSTTRNAVNVFTKFSVDLYSNNQSEVAAEDITVKYDNTKLKFLGLSQPCEGLDLLDCENNSTTPSSVRLIIVSDGECNIIKANTSLIKLNFQATTTGSAVVYTDNCTIADGDYMERRLSPSEIGGCVIKINCDVNGDGKFILADVAIIAKHLGEKDGDTPHYTMDLVPDGVIDKKDLEKAKECLLNNSNYNNH